MDFRRQNDEEDDDETVTYNPPSIRDPAFSKPLLPSSSSLIPSRAPPPSCGARNGAVNASPPDHSPASESGKGDASNYRECLRNHAASLGGHILDGCGEFMPSPADALKCAACGCHRSFHRREGEIVDHLFYRPHHHHHHHHNGAINHSPGGRIPLLLPPPQLAPQHKHIHSFSSSPTAGMVAFGNASGGGTTTESSSEELGLPPSAAAQASHLAPFLAPSSKKRYRTKFTSEQKSRMMDFAERICWRIQRQDESAMERFCSEVGISRQVFKVWMHNNKHSIRKQQQQQQLQFHEPLQQQQQQQQQLQDL